MHEQVGEHDGFAIGRRMLEPLEDVRGNDLDGPTDASQRGQGGGRHGRLRVEQRDDGLRPAARAVLRQTREQRAVAGAELDEAKRLARRDGVERARKHAGVTHDSVHDAQVAPRAQRAGVVRRKLVEQLRDDAARPARGPFRTLRQCAHATSSSAPWQLKPAPNDDIHHQPPCARSARAASSTKYTNALLKLPYSRRTPALYRVCSSLRPNRCRSASSTSRPPACQIQAAISVRSIPARPSTSSRTRSACDAASLGTGRVRTLRSIPLRCSKRRASRSTGFSTEPMVLHSIERLLREARCESTAAPAPSPNRHALTRTPGSLSRYIAALLTSTHTESTFSERRAASSASAICQFGSAAAQPCPTRSKAARSGRRPSRSMT